MWPLALFQTFHGCTSGNRPFPACPVPSSSPLMQRPLKIFAMSRNRCWSEQFVTTSQQLHCIIFPLSCWKILHSDSSESNLSRRKTRKNDISSQKSDVRSIEIEMSLSIAFIAAAEQYSTSSTKKMQRVASILRHSSIVPRINSGPDGGRWHTRNPAKAPRRHPGFVPYPAKENSSRSRLEDCR